jgi:hypothetical protein
MSKTLRLSSDNRFILKTILETSKPGTVPTIAATDVIANVAQIILPLELHRLPRFGKHKDEKGVEKIVMPDTSDFRDYVLEEDAWKRLVDTFHASVNFVRDVNAQVRAADTWQRISVPVTTSGEKTPPETTPESKSGAYAAENLARKPERKPLKKSRK